MLPIANNTKITALDYAVVFNLDTGYLQVSLAPSQFLPGGAAALSGARLTVIAPSGAVLSDGQALAFLPPLDTAVSIALPRFAGAVMWGFYRFRVVLVDGTTLYTLEKTFELCDPAGEHWEIALRADCEEGMLRVYSHPPAYKGVAAQTFTPQYSYYYPQVLHLPPLELSAAPFEVPLYTGDHLVKGWALATYAFAGGFSVLTPLRAEAETKAYCGDYCHLVCAMEKLLLQRSAAIYGSAQWVRVTETLDEANRLLPTLLLAARCGEAADDIARQLEDLLQEVDCGCGQPLYMKPPCPSIADMEILVTTTTTTLAPTTTTTTTTLQPTTTTTTTTTTTLAPLACPGVTVESARLGVKVTVTPVAGATSYAVRVYSDANLSIQVAGVIVPQPESLEPFVQTFTGLQGLQTYYVQVLPSQGAYQRTGCGVYSAVAQAVIACVVPVLTPGTTNVSVTWPAPPEADMYYVNAWGNEERTIPYGSVTTFNAFHNFTGLPPASPVFVQVLAFNTDGQYTYPENCPLYQTQTL